MCTFLYLNLQKNILIKHSVEGGAEGSGAKLGLGFTEEMAMELRSSTEELDFQDPAENETRARRKKLQQQHAVSTSTSNTNFSYTSVCSITTFKLYTLQISGILYLNKFEQICN